MFDQRSAPAALTLRSFAGPSSAIANVMRPLSQKRSRPGPSQRSPIVHGHTTRTIIVFAISLTLSACASVSGGGSTTPPPPQIAVSITPNPGTVLLGNTLAFSATVTNTSDTSVSWGVNGVSGGSPQIGTISTDGLFTAPADLPPGGKVQVTAPSHADSSKSSTAGVTISSDIAVSISPVSASVELGALQAFHATIASSGKPDTSIRWS